MPKEEVYDKQETIEMMHELVAKKLEDDSDFSNHSRILDMIETVAEQSWSMGAHHAHRTSL